MRGGGRLPADAAGAPTAVAAVTGVAVMPSPTSATTAAATATLAAVTLTAAAPVAADDAVAPAHDRVASSVAAMGEPRSDVVREREG